MGLGIVIVVAFAAFLVWALTRSNVELASATPAPRSPLDEAERILAARYARGEITPQEYQRMLTILRH